MVAGKTERTLDQSRHRKKHQSRDAAGDPQRTKSPFAAHKNLERIERSRVRGKKKRIDRLYKRIPKNAHVVCYDEFGPIEVRPIHGRIWGVEGSPTRLPATYTRTLGTRQYLAFYDLRQDKLWGYFSIRKRWMEVLQVLKRMRAMYPSDERIYLVLDNFSPHKRAEIKLWARSNKVSLVWTATNASWLNRI